MDKQNVEIKDKTSNDPLQVSKELNVRTNSSDGTDEYSAATEDPGKGEFEPKVGMEFESEDGAYKFYNEYAKIVGFSVRKKDKNARYGVITNRTFCCSKSGFRGKDKRNEDVKKPRAETRTGCQADIKISRKENGKYVVYKFESVHNHELVPPNMIHLLRSHRDLTSAETPKASIRDNSMFAPRAAMKIIGKQDDGRKNLGFIPRGFNNSLHSKRGKQMRKGDAGGLLEYFQMKQIENPLFFHAIQLDEEELITNIFWADARMIVDYSYFGDVVCFDTSYKTNKEGYPLGLFVGVNHLKQMIVFGATLLYDETLSSFEWLFRTFARAMSGKKPLTILTDEDHVMHNAIRTVWPDSYHRLCLWHMYQNAAKHIHEIFERHKSFEEDFQKCIYEYEGDEEFLDAWSSMIKKYDLHTNEWLEGRFKEREKWSLAYGRNNFCADISSIQKSESMYSTLKKYLNSQKDVLHFLKHFDRVLTDQRYKELQADCKMKQRTPIVAGPISILDHAKTVYTPPTFEMVQNEVLQVLNCHAHPLSEVGTVKEYKVFNSRDIVQHQHNVTFDSSNTTVCCSCKKFEFTGILCDHALKILNINEIMKIPDRYILRRWTKDAKSGSVESVHCESNIENDIGLVNGRRFKDLCHHFVQLATKAADYKGTYDIAVGYVKQAKTEVDEFLKHVPLEEAFTANSCVQSESEQVESINIENIPPIDLEDINITTSCGSDCDSEDYVGRKTFATARGVKQKVRVGHITRAVQNIKKAKDSEVVHDNVEELTKKRRYQNEASQMSNSTLGSPCQSNPPTPSTQELIGGANSSSQSLALSTNQPSLPFQNMCQMLSSLNPNICQSNHGQSQQESHQKQEPLLFNGQSREPPHSAFSFIQEARHSDAEDQG